MRRYSGARAIVEAATGKACTFQELELRADAWCARHVANPHEIRGRAVIFAVPNGIAWLEIFLGLAKAGAVIVPLDPGEPAEAQRRLAKELRAGFWWDGERLVGLSHARRFRDPDTCLIKLTSGTTGKPRPLVFTARQLLADTRQVTTTMGIRPSDLNYALIPLGHSYGLGNLTLPLIAQGVPLVCGSAALPQVIAKDFARWRPTVFPSVPAVWRAIVAAEIAPDDFASLRRAISAGAPLPVEVARDFATRFYRRIHGFYGSSETGGIAYDRTGAATLAGGVGRALQGVQITPRSGQRLRVCSAAVLTIGNRRREAGKGCWVLPDRAAVDHRGNITLLGRTGTTVKIGGRRLSLAEVSARLSEVTGVRGVWIGASRDTEPVLGVAVVSERPVAELRAALLARTAAWKVPKRWVLLADFPLTARGKIDARALHARVFG